MNSTETPGGSGIPAGWYDDPGGQGLRWWDGEQWTEHVHTPESAAAATAGATTGAGEREAPPPDLVRLRESVRTRGSRGVGMVLGALVLVIVVVALLVSGGSESNGGGEPGTILPSAGGAGASQAVIKQLKAQLENAQLPEAEKKALEAELKKFEEGGDAKGKSSSGGGKPSKSGQKKTASGEEGS